MIGATYPFLNSVGSDPNLSGALSAVVPVVAESPSATLRHQHFPLCTPVIPLSSRRFRRSTPYLFDHALHDQLPGVVPDRYRNAGLMHVHANILLALHCVVLRSVGHTRRSKPT